MLRMRVARLGLHLCFDARLLRPMRGRKLYLCHGSSVPGAKASTAPCANTGGP